MVWCSVLGCENEGTDPHHITYDPPVEKPLCHEHHMDLTAIQAHAARNMKGYIRKDGYHTHYQQLTNKQRWYFWYNFIQGKLKSPRKTHFDRDWENHNNE